jgi:hypothetical protein
MRALFGFDSACEGSNCRNDQGQDQQQPQQLVHGDASDNRRHAEENSENDRNESQRSVSPPRILPAWRPNGKGIAGLAELAARERVDRPMQPFHDGRHLDHERGSGGRLAGGLHRDHVRSLRVISCPETRMRLLRSSTPTSRPRALRGFRKWPREEPP